MPQPVREYPSSRADRSPQQADAAVCGHWAIENKLHWPLDVTLREDAHHPRDATATENRTLIRKMALHLLQADPTPVSKKGKCKRLAWNETYLEELLARICHQLQ